MKKVALITGASGFIGQHLSKRLIKEGFGVYSFGREVLYDPTKLSEQVKIVSPSHIFNLAAYGNHRIQTDDDETIAANYMLTYLLLKYTKNTPYELFVQFGSSSEYGERANPMHEGEKLVPTTLYGATKAGASILTNTFGRVYKKPTVVVRPFSVYGEGEADFRFIPKVIRSLIEDEEMNVNTEANHDWIYINDFIDGVMTVCETVKTEGFPVHTEINIGTGTQTNNGKIIKLLEGISGKKLKYKDTYSMSIGDSQRWVADNGFLKFLKWTENIGLKEGLKRTYKYYKKIYERE